MASDIIQADYEILGTIAQRFTAQGEAMAALRQQLVQRANMLDGSWRGQGASAFQAEMQGELLPALQRLAEALDEAGRTTEQVSATVRQAEEEAAGLFRGEASAQPGEGEGLWDRFGEWVHGGLDVLGLVPAFGEVADGANGLIYLAEGRHIEAGLSFAAMIPIVGWGAVASKVGLRVVREGAEMGAERALREGAESGMLRSLVEAAADRAEPFLRTALERSARMGNRNYEELAELIAKGGDENLAIISERLGVRVQYDPTIGPQGGRASWNGSEIRLSPHSTPIESSRALFHEVVHTDLVPRGPLEGFRQNIRAHVYWGSPLLRYSEEVLAEGVAQLRTGGTLMTALEMPLMSRKDYRFSENNMVLAANMVAEGGLLGSVFGAFSYTGYRIGISLRPEPTE